VDDDEEDVKDEKVRRRVPKEAWRRVRLFQGERERERAFPIVI